MTNSAFPSRPPRSTAQPPRLWDLSPPVAEGSPVFPGDTPYHQRWSVRIGPGCPVNVASVTLSPHAGAHADGPLHYDPQGLPIGLVPLEPYLGPCRVVHVMDLGPMVSAQALAQRMGSGLPCPPRVLLRQYQHLPRDRFDTDLPALSAEAVSWLADQGVVLIGTDSASVDPASDKTLPSHQVLRERGLRVLENLCLDAVPEGDYELIALPLRWTAADASPVRAVLRSL